MSSAFSQKKIQKRYNIKYDQHLYVIRDESKNIPCKEFNKMNEAQNKGKHST